jgi:hypothetical protein
VGKGEGATMKLKRQIRIWWFNLLIGMVPKDIMMVALGEAIKQSIIENNGVKYYWVLERVVEQEPEQYLQ